MRRFTPSASKPPLKCEQSAGGDLQRHPWPCTASQMKRALHDNCESGTLTTHKAPKTNTVALSGFTRSGVLRFLAVCSQYCIASTFSGLWLCCRTSDCAQRGPAALTAEARRQRGPLDAIQLKVFPIVFAIFLMLPPHSLTPRSDPANYVPSRASSSTLAQLGGSR